jgi:predicted RNA-binding protein with PIN domain
VEGEPRPPVVLVDARNVMRSRWPNFREDRFVALTRLWAEREGAELVVVFDGRAPGGVLGIAELDERTALVGAGDEIADDWIAREAARLAGSGRRVRLVSSDRELRERVSSYVEQIVGGGAFATLLENLEREGGEEA